ncbi:hypothetical protein ACQJBY_006220 [Aegilops geniculata]
MPCTHLSRGEFPHQHSVCLPPCATAPGRPLRRTATPTTIPYHLLLPSEEDLRCLAIPDRSFGLLGAMLLAGATSFSTNLGACHHLSQRYPPPYTCSHTYE